MSYEKISGVRFNPKKNILEFKSHSNNDDATPSWWSIDRTEFKDKVAATYQYWLEGSIQTNAKTGVLLKLRVAFYKFTKKMREELGERPDYDNNGKTWEEKCKPIKEYYEKQNEYINSHKDELLKLTEEKDSKPMYNAFWKGFPVCKIHNNGRIEFYVYQNESGLRLTKMQTELLGFLRDDLTFKEVHIL